MEKRFELVKRPLVDWIHDKKLYNTYDATDFCDLVNLLNEQDEKIKSETTVKEFWHSAYKEKELTNDLLLKENQQLKQSQYSKAIEELERLRNFYNSDSESDWLIDCCKLEEYINNQITELKK